MTVAESLGIPPRLMTYTEAGAIIGAGKRYIRNRVKDGRLKGTDLGHHFKRIAPLDFITFLTECRTLERRRK